MGLWLWMAVLLAEHDEAAGPDAVPFAEVVRTPTGLVGEYLHDLHRMLDVLDAQAADEQVPRKSGASREGTGGGISP